MSNEKHSPAPWLHRAKSDGVYGLPEAGTAYKFGAHYFSFREDAAPSDADLALILAAPDLLEALQEILAFVVQEHDGHGCKRWPDVIAAQEAIARATGESQ